MKYTFKTLLEDFPDDDYCLQYLFAMRYPQVWKQYYRIKGRKSFVNKSGHQIHPLAGTIFEKSSTPLTSWFFAIYLFAQSRNGVAAKELQRHIGVTYKTAWRMGHLIRNLMIVNDAKLLGYVQVDETFIGGRKRYGFGGRGKIPIIGMANSVGDIKTKVTNTRQTHDLLNAVLENVEKGSYMMTDQLKTYRKLTRIGYYRHSTVNHNKKEWARGYVTTNKIEGFWGLMKPSFKGTYRSVSKQHLQAYTDEFTFRYNQRNVPSPMFELLLQQVWKQ